MKESKHEIGTVTVNLDEKIEELEIVSALIGIYKGERKATVAKTESDTYVLSVSRIVKGDTVEHNMHLTKESFAALICSCITFMDEDGMQIEQLIKLCMDENSSYAYKTNKDVEEETV